MISDATGSWSGGWHRVKIDNVPIMELPSFSQWVPWPQGYSLKDCDYPGLYLLRRFDVEPTTHLGPVDAELVYIGITCDRTLKKRWYEFNRSAYERKNGHSGGWTFNSLYCGNEIAEASLVIRVMAACSSRGTETVCIHPVCRAMADLGARPAVRKDAGVQYQVVAQVHRRTPRVPRSAQGEAK
jgi:hypothetical protein